MLLRVVFLGAYLMVPSNSKSIDSHIEDDTSDYPVPEYCGRSQYHEEHHEIFGGKPLEELKRVIGGSVSERGEWPWLVSLQFTASFSPNSSHFCGGNLINDQWILTAAHCCELAEWYSHPDYNIKQTIRLGEHHFDEEEDSQIDIEIEKFVVHPDYVGWPVDLSHDIALIKLAKKVKFNKHVNVICLPPAEYQVMAGTPLVTSGWGTTELYGELSPVVKHLIVPSIEHEICEKIYSNITVNFTYDYTVCDGDYDYDYKQKDKSSVEEENCRNETYNYSWTGSENITDDMMCAGWLAGGMSNCHGDSGGPLVYYNREIKGWVLVGLVSWSYGCAKKGAPEVYARVSAFMPWIEKTIEEDGLETTTTHHKPGCKKC